MSNYYSVFLFLGFDFAHFILNVVLCSAVRTELRLCDLIVCVGHPEKQPSQKVQNILNRQQQPHHQ